jgi:hypothetical protein
MLVRHLADRIRTRIAPALLTALGVTFLAAGVLSLTTTAAADPVQPQFRSKDLLIPIGPLSVKDNRVAVRRQLHTAETDRIKKFVDVELWFRVLSEHQAGRQK